MHGNTPTGEPTNAGGEACVDFVVWSPTWGTSPDVPLDGRCAAAR